jgi:H+/Cl- antiporter ClcA
VASIDVARFAPTLRARFAAVSGAVLLSLLAIVFARCGDYAQQAFSRGLAQWPYLPLALTPAVFVIVVQTTQRCWPEARGSGIPQAIAAGRDGGASANGPLLSLKTAAAKAGGTLAMLLAGASVGREGPTVQVSTAIMAAVHRWLRVPITGGVVIAGGAAGVAAAFNTPLAGVAFAIEELASAFEQRVAVFVMAAVMISGMVSLGLAGDYVYFGTMSTGLPFRTMIVVAPLAGMVGGAAGGLFSRAILAMGRWQTPLSRKIRGFPILFAGGCGLVVALAGLWSGGLTWGTGYEATKDLLSGNPVPPVFGPAKFIATTATALSGAPGGIFAPSLSVGAGLGQLLALLVPGAPVGAVVLLGMAGYFTGVVRAPLTASIIMMEMTAERSMVLPLFAAALIADWISSQVCPHKLYHALSTQFAKPASAKT